jgi:hypothetical protein
VRLGAPDQAAEVTARLSAAYDRLEAARQAAVEDPEEDVLAELVAAQDEAAYAIAEGQEWGLGDQKEAA